MAKQKMALEGLDVDAIEANFKEKYKDEKVNDIDGVKVDFAESWVHLRRSNTEPIIRIYTEAKSQEEADALAERIIAGIKRNGISNSSLIFIVCTDWCEYFVPPIQSFG